ncbi:MAG: helix-turn-helix transcriptional regulator, partial [Syntrophales bacterium]
LSSETLTGKDLARIRTELSVSLEQISERTKVRIWLLQCIEDDRVDQLPSPFHLKKFLEFYAESLGLDGKTVVEKYTKRFSS